jgi:hypothetical protein
MYNNSRLRSLNIAMQKRYTYSATGKGDSNIVLANRTFVTISNWKMCRRSRRDVTRKIASCGLISFTVLQFQFGHLVVAAINRVHFDLIIDWRNDHDGVAQPSVVMILRLRNDINVVVVRLCGTLCFSRRCAMRLWLNSHESGLSANEQKKNALNTSSDGCVTAILAYSCDASRALTRSSFVDAACAAIMSVENGVLR